MSRELAKTLETFAEVATLVSDRGARQVWRFEQDGRPYYLRFYRRDESRLKRLIKGSPAWREFEALRRLQKADVPAPRAVAHLLGFVLKGVKGDAVIVEGIEPSEPLDRYLDNLALQGEPIPHHRDLVEQVLQILEKMLDAKLGHADLQLGSFVIREGRLFLVDARAVRRKGFWSSDLFRLGHSARRRVTRTDLLRAWRGLGFGLDLPRRNPVSPHIWRNLLSRITRENRWYGRLAIGEWSGHFVKRTDIPRRWAPASRIVATHDDWQREWPRLLEQMRADQLDVLKRDRAGEVFAGEVVIGGHPIEVVVKRHGRKQWHRYLTDIGRGTRARRAWRKAWQLVMRDVPTAWPMLVMERRVLGYVMDAVIVFERVPGPIMRLMDLDALSPMDRDTLFRRLGRTLRLIEEGGLSQNDSKTCNWIVASDEKLGLVPVVIDLDGVRRNPGWPRAMERLLRSLRRHAQYTPADSLALCQGYAPFARVQREASGTTQTGASRAEEPS